MTVITPGPAATDAPTTSPAFDIQTEGLLHPWIRREWLLTNGSGAFASGTVVGSNSRRYHGLLVAATMPPVGRVLALSRIGEILYLDGDRSRMLELGVNQFRDTVHPRGDRFLRSFHLWHTARWEFDVEGVRVTKELLLGWKKNLIGIRYTVDARRKRQVRLELAPFTPLRDFHSARHRNGMDFQLLYPGGQTPSVLVRGDGNTLCAAADVGTFEGAPDWWYGHVFPIESDRGLDDNEDLFTPGRFVSESNDGKLRMTFWATLGEAFPVGPVPSLASSSVGPVPSLASSSVGPVPSLAPANDAKKEMASEGTGPTLPHWDAELKAVVAGRGEGNLPGKSATSPTVRRLVRAAGDFVVDRTAPDGKPGNTILAGYPWFADWGRDTFIALPGLLLATKRFEEARRVLTVFGHYVNGGMIPNRFDDYTNEPSYNTVDASLWYVHSAFEYARLSGDTKTFEADLRPACRKIIDGYRDGTGRYHIRMDPADGLITQGDATTQLTWMDAKCGDIAFTPRQGKAVEINALWYHALVLMGEKEQAAKTADGFRKAYWLGGNRGLADGFNEGRQDKLIRPNQIFAVSLANSPLTPEQQREVVDVVRRELLTPVGLRTLARSEPGYRGRYTGPQYIRDEAYHNGTIWPWPIGAFLSAYLRVHDHGEPAREQCRQWLAPLVKHMEENCLGQIAEIFEADEPHRPVGCCAQAWSVAEVLRLAVELDM